MKIVFVNGEIRKTEVTDLVSFLKELNLPEDGWALARNGMFVPKSKYQDYKISDNDDFEIVSAHPGG